MRSQSRPGPGIVTRSIMGHVSEVMTNHYSMADATEKAAAVAAVFELVRREGAAWWSVWWSVYE